MSLFLLLLLFSCSVYRYSSAFICVQCCIVYIGTIAVYREIQETPTIEERLAPISWPIISLRSCVVPLHGTRLQHPEFLITHTDWIVTLNEPLQRPRDVSVSL